MIRMKMRDDHAPDRLAVKVLRKNLLPAAARLVGGETAIDYRPTVAIFEQPQVDVVQHKRQRHAQPKHAGRNGGDGAGRGRLGDGVAQAREVELGLFEGSYGVHSYYAMLDVIFLYVGVSRRFFENNGLYCKAQ